MKYDILTNMIKRVEESYQKNALPLVGGPLIKLVEAVFDLLIPLFMKAVIDLSQYHNPDNITNPFTRGLAYFIRSFPMISDNQNLSDALIGGFIILFMGVVGFFVTMLAQYIAACTAVKVSTEVRNSLFEKILRLSKKEKNELGNDHLLTVLNSDTYQIQQGVLIFIRLIARAPFIILGSLIISFFLDWRIGLAFSFTVPLILLVIFLVLRKASRNYVDIQNKLDDISYKNSDTVEGARVVRAFNNQEKENEAFEKESSNYRKLAIGVNRINALINPLTFAITSIVLIVIILLLQGSLFSTDIEVKTFVSSTLITEMAYLSQIFFTTVQLTGVLLDLTKAKVARGRINKVLLREEELVNGNIKELIDNDELVRFNNVYFSYKNDSDTYALKNINFSLNKGETLGIIGGIGSGKSTIINLLMRFFDPSKGEVFYKGNNLKDYDFETFRKDIGLVNQKSSLFTGTIKSNLLMANEKASEEDILEALKASQAYEFVSKYEDYIDHEVKEKGTNFSGGQRQRLCIARSLIRKPDLLILDDATSALDLLTDKKIREYLSKNKKMGKVIVSSRVATIMNANKIIVIDKGEIVGLGKHEELLKNCPIYLDIYNTQIKKGKYE